MEFFFYALPTAMACGVLLMAAQVVRRSTQVSRAWNSGLTAEARCLRTYTTTSGHGGDGHVSTTLHHVYEFTTRDGRPVRFEEEGGPATTVQGDVVTVRYTAERPEAATAYAPRPFVMAAGTVGTLCFLGLMLAFCVFFMVQVHDGFALDGGGFGDYDDMPYYDDMP
ncbi:DUF3592 domain-containing protein [Streptomyces sp. NPDC048518]|uniref:DUF3592 domain-containing protein n=1 Tax=Streptomyces sp. NPDC048518 TaxID=3155029 RepID=UPI00340B5F65